MSGERGSSQLPCWDSSERTRGAHASLRAGCGAPARAMPGAAPKSVCAIAEWRGSPGSAQRTIGGGGFAATDSEQRKARRKSACRPLQARRMDWKRGLERERISSRRGGEGSIRPAAVFVEICVRAGRFPQVRQLLPLSSGRMGAAGWVLFVARRAAFSSAGPAGDDFAIVAIGGGFLRRALDSLPGRFDRPARRSERG